MKSRKASNYSSILELAISRQKVKAREDNRSDHCFRAALPKVRSLCRSNRTIPYRVLIMSRRKASPFNCGAVLNIGFKPACDESDYTCFHDADYLPVWADYSWADVPSPIMWHGPVELRRGAGLPVRRWLVHAHNSSTELSVHAIYLVAERKFGTGMERSSGYYITKFLRKSRLFTRSPDSARHSGHRVGGRRNPFRDDRSGRKSPGQRYVPPWVYRRLKISAWPSAAGCPPRGARSTTG
jgi:hypothetical protein